KPMEPVVRRLVVARHARWSRGSPSLPRVLAELGRPARGVATGTGDDRHASGGMLDRDADQRRVLLHVDRRRFAGGADDRDRLRALLDVPVDETPIAVEIEAAVLVHRADDRDYAAPDHDGRSLGKQDILA